VQRIVNIVGTRPNLVKMAALFAAQRARPADFTPLLVHTGQHRDPAMSDQFFVELELPPADVSLDCGGGGRAEQIARMRHQLPPILTALRPDLVVVVGDVNSTAAAALSAAQLGLPIAHVEAGLRSFDRSMPEEENRILVDSLSDLCFASEPSAVENLAREGRPAAAVHLVGNVMIDTLVRFRARAAARDPRAALGLQGRYAVLTLHRPATVDHAAVLTPLLRALGTAAARVPILFPVHPRTRSQLDAFGLGAVLAEFPGLRPLAPLGYLDMLALMEHAELVLTDSGGVQEETTFLGVPCLTLRDNTERPVTVTDGTNRVIGTASAAVIDAIDQLLAGQRPPRRCPPLWDGHAAARVVAVLAGDAPPASRAGGGASTTARAPR
jgi:UDP-N-acetylglucosamine 2-epimerase (non-hydrolysing)